MSNLSNKKHKNNINNLFQFSKFTSVNYGPCHSRSVCSYEEKAL